jgi:hypothetical protein
MFPHTYYGGTYFGPTYFGGGGGVGFGLVTSTRRLQLPINCILAGQQHYTQSGREFEIRSMNATEKTWGRHSSVRALKGGKPSFTITSNKRGYD